MVGLRIAWIVVACACGGAQRGTSEQPAVVVVDPGAEPRRVLRYVFVPKAPEYMEASYKLRAETKFTNTVLEQGHSNVDLPTVISRGRVDVIDVDAAGRARIEHVVEDVEVLNDVVDPNVRERAVSRSESLRGLRTSWSMSPSGVLAETIVAVRPWVKPAATSP